MKRICIGQNQVNNTNLIKKQKHSFTAWDDIKGPGRDALNNVFSQIQPYSNTSNQPSQKATDERKISGYHLSELVFDPQIDPSRIADRISLEDPSVTPKGKAEKFQAYASDIESAEKYTCDEWMKTQNAILNLQANMFALQSRASELQAQKQRLEQAKASFLNESVNAQRGQLDETLLHSVSPKRKQTIANLESLIGGNNATSN